MTTARSIIEQACKKIHVLGRGQTLPPEEAADALLTLNNLLGSLSAEGGLVYTESKDTHTCDGSTSYTIGSGGDINTTKPYDISAVFIRQGTSDHELTKYDQKQYAGITSKSTAGQADIYYYDNNHTLGNLYLHPVPDASYAITIYSTKPLTEFTSLTDDIDLPSPYERMLVTNLALDLAPDYEREPSMQLTKSAGEAKANVFKYNTRNSNNVADMDSALVPSGGFDIYRGY